MGIGRPTVRSESTVCTTGVPQRICPRPFIIFSLYFSNQSYGLIALESIINSAHIDHTQLHIAL